MATDLTIRPARPENLAQIVEANVAMALETEERALPGATVTAGVQRVLNDPALGQYFLADLDKHPAGQMLVTYEWSDWRNGLFWWIQSVYVKPEFRRRGIYRALHEHVTRLARQDPQVCGLRLYVDRDNTTARQVYEQLGLRATNYTLMEVDWS